MLIKRSKMSTLKSIEFDAELLELLAAADKLFENSFKEFGKKDDADSMKTSKEVLGELVKAVQIEKNITYEQAYAEVVATAEGRKLVHKTYKEE